MKSFLLRLVACLFVVSSSSHAALYDRGNGLIYDDVLDITWMQDANYAQTSGYAAANAVGGLNSGSTNLQADGRMGWDAAITWADQLKYGGYGDWRLASSGSAPTETYSAVEEDDELSHMFYNNLGNTAFTSILNNVSFTDATLGGGTESFLNVQDYSYWYAEEDTPTYTWAFSTEDGGKYYGYGKGSSLYSWAVRAGDVSTVPVPAAAWLFGSALAGCLVANRKRS
jgi:hypothetical protein